MPKRIPTRRPPGYRDRKEQKREFQAKRIRTDEIQRLYQTPRWRDLRPVILARDPYCVRCLAKHPRIVTPATVVNHKRKARDAPELFFDPENLEGVCAPCHNSDIQKEEKSHGNKTT